MINQSEGDSPGEEQELEHVLSEGEAGIKERIEHAQKLGDRFFSIQMRDVVDLHALFLDMMLDETGSSSLEEIKNLIDAITQGVVKTNNWLPEKLPKSRLHFLEQYIFFWIFINYRAIYSNMQWLDKPSFDRVELVYDVIDDMQAHSLMFGILRMLDFLSENKSEVEKFLKLMSNPLILTFTRDYVYYVSSRLEYHFQNLVNSGEEFETLMKQIENIIKAYQKLRPELSTLRESNEF